MIQRRSPPKHRHDGTSPLPLGMDWSPSPLPRKWDGHSKVRPHDPRTGWSYCVAIPSWVFLPKSRDSDPVVLYRVQVGVQSPVGITTSRGVLRRFNDFMKLFTALKKAFPNKNLPAAPPKGLLRMKSRVQLEERRCSLEDWMTKLLSDIDVSRSMAVASFLELEAAARSSFQDNPQSLEVSVGDPTNSSLNMPLPSSSSALAGSSSVASDCGSDTAYDTSELGTPQLDESSEIGAGDLALDEDLTSPIQKLVKYGMSNVDEGLFNGMSNIDEGLFMGQAILEELESFPRHKPLAIDGNKDVGSTKYNGNVSQASILAGNGLYEPENSKGFGHGRKLSSESVGSDGSSLKGDEILSSGVQDPSGEASLGFHGGSVVSRAMEILGNSEPQFSGDAQIVLPLDQRHKMSRILLTMERRLVTAKTDMEDVLSRLNQEMAVKEYLTTKVKDLEGEVETMKQKHKENLQQAISIERERLTKMQWDMEEMKRKSLEMDLKLKSEEDGKSGIKQSMESTEEEKDMALQQLDATRKQLEDLSSQYQELEAKSKADIKFLAKEFKSLKSSHTELKQELSQSEKEKSEVEKLLEEERETRKHEKNERKKLLHNCRILCNQLQECNIDLSSEEHNCISDSSLTNALDLLTMSDNQIGRLLSQVQQLDEDQKTASSEDDATTDNELKKMLANVIADNATLRKQVNSITRKALQKGFMSRNNGDVSLNKIDHVDG